MKESIDFFAMASKHFLTQEMSYKEYDRIVMEGEALPKSEDYEDWDVDYLEEHIKQFANLLKKAYKIGKDGNDN